MAPQPSPPLDEICLDQLIYLMDHARACATPECAECARLLEVLQLAQEPLLRPFTTKGWKL